MKKLLLLLLGLGMALPSGAALSTGDDAAKLEVEAVKGGNFNVEELDNAPENKIRVIIFAQVRTPMGRDASAMLGTMRNLYAAKNFDCALIALDSSADIDFFLRENPNLSFSLLRDEKQKSANEYLGPRPILPKAFVIDRSGEIIWDGEAGDLPEMLDKYYAGKYSSKTQEKVSPLLEELRILIRGGDDRKADEITRKVLSLDPGNSAALRLRLFMLESTNRQEQAWKLITDEIKKNPQVRRYYLVAFDFAVRYSAFRRELPALSKDYLANFPADENFDTQLAWTLLSRLEFNLSAVKTADTLLARIKGENFKTMATRALLKYKQGKIGEAVKYQTKANEYASGLIQRDEGKQLLEYYQGIAGL